MTNRPAMLFRAVGVVAALFVLTVFVMIAALFSDQELPINVWLNRYALPVLLAEVGLLLLLGFAAIITDRPGPKPESAVEDDK